MHSVGCAVGDAGRPTEPKTYLPSWKGYRLNQAGVRALQEGRYAGGDNCPSRTRSYQLSDEHGKQGHPKAINCIEWSTLGRMEENGDRHKSCLALNYKQDSGDQKCSVDDIWEDPFRHSI